MSMALTSQESIAKLSPSEYELIQKLLGRLPNQVELAMFGVMWSEHCAYKNSKKLLRLFPKSSSKTKVLAGPGENAGIVDFGDGIKIAFKIESHNRPTAIEPFQGATTGIGGIIRDILTLGARPIALLNSLHFGLDQKSDYLLKHAVAGIGHYGNCTGIPTIGGQISYDLSYSGNPVVNAMCIGLLETDQPIPSASLRAGLAVLYVGSSTGRDGLGGAAFASNGLNDSSAKDRPAVQIGDPFLGKLLIEGCLEAYKSGMVIASQDMGAAGLTCACSEMSAKGDYGIELNLDLVPSRGELDTHEYMLSESQERMLFLVEQENVSPLCELLESHGLNACQVGVTTHEPKLKVFHRGKCVVDLPPRTLVDDAPEYDRTSQPLRPKINILGTPDLPHERELCEKAILEKLNDINFKSKSWIYRQFDQQVQLNTLVLPGEGDAAVLRLRKPDGELSQIGLAATVDCNSRYIKANPHLGAQIAVAEAARNLACVGAEPVAITDNLNFGNPERPGSYWFLEQAVKGICVACEKLDLPVVSGNVSLYNQYAGDEGILPTPVIGMIGKLSDYKKRSNLNFRFVGDTIWLIGSTHNEEGCPTLDWESELSLHNYLLQLIANGLIHSCHDLSEGGLLLALIESMVTKKLSAQLILSNPYSLRLDSLLLGESQSRAIVSTKPDITLHHPKLKVEKIGVVTPLANLELRVHNPELELSFSWSTLTRLLNIEP
ncbi:MAG: phosphoribosylformylglycinamidine synthase subunit PurL [Candidatus Caenarcaniphilales bacterium]|nr:phosphoribosylformylglycinamidine synthase subunit PurL [Candidatus Caenarcaniphilales bacterium]